MNPLKSQKEKMSKANSEEQESIAHKITKEDLENNPGLENDVKEGDEVLIPADSFEAKSENSDDVDGVLEGESSQEPGDAENEDDDLKDPIEVVKPGYRECLCGELVALGDSVVTCKCGRKHIA